MSTPNLMSKLKELAGKAGRSIYERLTLARSILADHEYVAQHFGDESKAYETIEADCFGDLCGARSLSELLAMQSHFVDDKAWERCKWNLSRLLAEWDERPKDAPKAKREVNRVTVKDHEEVKQQLAETDAQLGLASKDRDSLRNENSQLRMRVAELEKVNIQLEARIDELERLLDRQLAGSRR